MTDTLGVSLICALHQELRRDRDFEPAAAVSEPPEAVALRHCNCERRVEALDQVGGTPTKASRHPVQGPTGKQVLRLPPSRSDGEPVATRADVHGFDPWHAVVEPTVIGQILVRRLVKE